MFWGDLLGKNAIFTKTNVCDEYTRSAGPEKRRKTPKNVCSSSLCTEKCELRRVYLRILIAVRIFRNFAYTHRNAKVYCALLLTEKCEFR